MRQDLKEMERGGKWEMGGAAHEAKLHVHLKSHQKERRNSNLGCLRIEFYMDSSAST